MNSDLGVFLMIGFFLVVIVGIVLFFFVLGKHAKEKNEECDRFINGLLMQVPDDKKPLFLLQYNNVRKNPTTAVLLALFLGGLGAHKFYLNQAGIGIVYLLFCWTYIPAIIAFIEAFTISGKVGEYNKRKAQEIMMMIGGRGL